MSYIVLARKYRPQNFDEVYAQDHITTILKNAISMDRLAHAFLFTGSRGVGKTSMARIMAKSLNCMEGMSANPCGKCENCVEITGGTSTDVVEIDGASNTGVEDIRDLQKELMYSTTKSQFKIFIIDEVHMLSKNAFNALLKTLEEPPSQVIFIFATTEPHKVIPTIISRCQRYDFKRIPVEAIVRRLQYICEREKITIEQEAFYIIAKKAEGSMRDALSLTDQLLATGKVNISTNDVLSLFGIVHNEVFHKITAYIHQRKTGAIIGMIHSLLDKGNDLQEFLSGYLEYLRNLLLIKTNVPLPELPANIKKEMDEIAPLFAEDTILYLLAVLIKTKTDIKYFSNPILLVEMTFIKLSKMEEMKSISELLKNWQYNAVPAQQTVAKQQRQVPKYTPSQPAPQSVREPAHKPPKYSEITKDVYHKEKENIVNILTKSLPFGASIFSQLELEDVSDNLLTFKTGKKTGIDYLNREKQKVADIISRYFDMKLGIKVIFDDNEAKTAPKSINNLTIDDIEKESPDLAKFIKISDAEVTQIKDKKVKKP